MSFGFSVGDIVLLSQLAWTAVQNSKKACGAHDELTQEVTCLHIVLQRLRREVEKPNSLISRTNDGRLDELQTIVKGCGRILKVIDQVLVKYNGISDEKRKITKFRLKVQFGNGEMKDIGKIRQELSTYTSAITLFLNLLSMGSLGKVEEHMENHGTELRELRQSLNWITASLQAGSGNREGSILTSYADDDKAIWKEFRRELLKEGFRSSELSKHKAIIKDYVMELGSRGALDVPEVEETTVEAEYSIKEEVSAGEENEILAGDPSTSKSELPAKIPSWSSSDSTKLIEEMTLIPVYLAETLDNGKSSDPISATQSTLVPIHKVTNEDKIFEQDHPTASTVILDETDEGYDQSEGSSDSEELEAESDEESLPLEGPQIPALESNVDSDKPRGVMMRDQEDVKNRNELCSIKKLTVTPKPTSVEEVEDEDFKSGAHPNCIAIGNSEMEGEDPQNDDYADFVSFRSPVESSEEDYESDERSYVANKGSEIVSGWLSAAALKIALARRETIATHHSRGEMESVAYERKSAEEESELKREHFNGMSLVYGAGGAGASSLVGSGIIRQPSASHVDEYSYNQGRVHESNTENELTDQHSPQILDYKKAYTENVELSDETPMIGSKRTKDQIPRSQIEMIVEQFGFDPFLNEGRRAEWEPSCEAHHSWGSTTTSSLHSKMEYSSGSNAELSAGMSESDVTRRQVPQSEQVLEEFGFDPFTSHRRKKTRSARAVYSRKGVY